MENKNYLYLIIYLVLLIVRTYNNHFRTKQIVIIKMHISYFQRQNVSFFKEVTDIERKPKKPQIDNLLGISIYLK